MLKVIKKAVSLVICLSTLTVLTCSASAITANYHGKKAIHPNSGMEMGDFNGTGGNVIANCYPFVWGFPSKANPGTFCQVSLTPYKSRKSVTMDFVSKSSLRDRPSTDYFTYGINIFDSSGTVIGTVGYDNKFTGNQCDYSCASCQTTNSSLVYAQAGGSYHSATDGDWYGGAYCTF